MDIGKQLKLESLYTLKNRFEKALINRLSACHIQIIFELNYIHKNSLCQVKTAH